jgi:hypothetical protein
MEKLLDLAIRVALSAFLSAGGVFAASGLVAELQQDAKGAMKAGISYSKFNQSLLRRR